MTKNIPFALMILFGQFAFSQVTDENFHFNLTRIKPSINFQSMAKQPDGKILVMGKTYFVNGKLQHGIMRLNADLTLDESFSSILAASPIISQQAIAIQPDGKIILGGVSGVGPTGIVFNKGIVRLNSDGSIDESFDPGTGFNQASEIRALDIDPSGKYVVFGKFTMYNGQPANCVARINTDGSLDNTFTVPAFSLMPTQIDGIYVQPDGRVVLGNTSMTYNGTPVPDVIRLNTDGSLDNTFNYNGPSPGITYLIIPEPASDKLIVIGYGFITRINSDGAVDNTYAGGTGHPSPRAAVRQSDNKIVIAGTSSVVRVNTDGSTDDTFSSVSSPTTNFRGVAIADNGNIIVADFAGSTIPVFNSAGVALAPVDLVHTEPATISPPEVVGSQLIFTGNFQFSSGNPVPNIISMDHSGTPTAGFNYYSSDAVNAIISDGNHFFATDATGAMVRVKSDGSADSDYTNAFLGNGGNGFGINVMKRLKNGKLLVGGSFPSFNSRPATARLFIMNANGTIDNSFTAPDNLVNVHEAAELPDGRIVIAEMTALHDDSLRLLSSTGILDKSFKIGFHNSAIVTDILVDTAGNIYACGTFNAVNGNVMRYFLKTSATGVLDHSFIQGDGFSSSLDGNGFNPNVQSIALEKDGKLLVGGNFISYNQEPANGLVRLHPDGTRDNTFVHSYWGSVTGITIIEDDIYVTGNFIRNFNPLYGGIVKYKKVLTGTEDLPSARSVFPNPNNGKFSIQMDNRQSATIKVTDMNGKLIYTASLPPLPVAEVNLGPLQAGFYVLSVFEGNHSKYYKLCIE